MMANRRVECTGCVRTEMERWKIAIFVRKKLNIAVIKRRCVVYSIQILGFISMSIRITIALTGLSLWLTGCATPPPVAVVQAKPDPVLARLDASLASAQAEAPRGPEVKMARPVYSSASNTVSYLGDAGNLLKDVAASLKLEYKVTGPQPHLPIYIQIDVEGVSLKELLSRVAVQLSQRADVVLSRGAIELRYRAP
jgi:hypothetical protein